MPQHWKQREAFLQQEPIIKGIVNKKQMALQTVHTPFSLCEEMIRKLTEYIGAYPKDLKILVYNVEFLDILYRMGIMWNNEIWFVNENPQQIQFARDIYVGDGNDKFICSKFLEIDKNMKKFSVVIGNPPYQTKSEASVTKTQVIWDKFVKKSIDMCEDDGYVCLVHPSGWRDVDGQFKDVQELLVSKDIKYLEIHDREDGVNTFGAQTAFDYYVLKNSKSSGHTTIKDYDGNISKIDLSSLKFIPNGMFDEISKLLAKDGEDRVNIARDASGCHTQKQWMSKEKTDEFKYPAVYTTLKDGTVNCWYSNTNKKGHFGISKVIFSNGTSYPIIDKTGEYGLTQFAYGIVDTAENLENIQTALLSTKFIELMDRCQLIGKHRYAYKVISMFRKDFWKQFVNENGKEI
jgi:hypothetical protein